MIHPEEAFLFFDSEKEGRLKKYKLKKMLRGSAVNDFIRTEVANELLKGSDELSGDTVNWEEFKVEISDFKKSL